MCVGNLYEVNDSITGDKNTGIYHLTGLFQHEQGYCWYVCIPEVENLADTPEKPQKSVVILYEDTRPLGPGHVIHAHIREYGSGRYSHWGQYLYFSTSDNTNPNTNNRRYFIKVMPNPSHEELKNFTQNIASEEAMLLETICANMNMNDRALYNLLHCFRLVKYFCSLAGEEITGKRILEVGSCKFPGLGLALLLSGCSKYYATNIIPVHSSLPAEYIKLIFLLMSALLGIKAERLKDVINWDKSGGKEYGYLNEQYFANFSPCPVEEINLPEGSVDMLFSLSVLEHVTRPEDVIKKCFNLLSPGGWCFHVIDLNDHANYNKPLDFLRYSQNDYLAKTNGSENRLRASDFIHLFRKSGFECIQFLFSDRALKLTSSGRVDVSDIIFQPFDHFWRYKSLDEVVPCVSSILLLFHSTARSFRIYPFYSWWLSAKRLSQETKINVWNSRTYLV